MSRPSRQPAGDERIDLAAALRREQIIEQFGAGLKAGTRLSIEDALGALPEGDRGEIFRELLFLELSHRRTNGERAEPHDYKRRFPEYSAEIFVAQLEDSGVLGAEAIKEFLPPQRHPKDAEELARELVRNKKLTVYQAEEVYKGKGKSLILGNYTILDKIGAGGMGRVFKAQHRRMKRVVAVKLIPPRLIKDPAIVARFEREVTAAARLTHPNIVTAFDADNVNGVYLLVMEYVDGRDLAALTKTNGPFPLDQAIDFTLQAARGLEAAHAAGIVHRDIKPGNLLLDEKRTVKILDLGLARILGEVAGRSDLTQSGAVMGTIDFMAPEQALNMKAADERADIYSLGCTLFYLLTGKAAYKGDTLMAKLIAHREDPLPSLGAIRPDVTGQVESVFRKMVEKKVEDRYQTMTALIADLELCRHGAALTIAAPALSDWKGNSNPTVDLQDVTTDFATRIQYTDRSRPPSAGGKKRMMIGAGILGAILLCALLVISLKTKEGTLVVTVSEPNADVRVFSATGEVEIARKGEKGPIKISVVPGTHQLKVSKDGFELFSRKFTLRSGDTEPIEATLLPLEASRAGSTDAVADRPKDDDNDGWVSLFNGKDLTGWRTQPEDTDTWEVKHGVLIGSGPEEGYLYSERGDYENVAFRVEARVNDQGNSGQFFRARVDKFVPSGYEAQINSNSPDPVRTGSLYFLVPVTDMLVEPGEWFTQEVIAEGNHIVILVNGKKVVDYTDEKKTYTKGRLALQHMRKFAGHETTIEFRKVEVKELAGR